MTEIYCHNCHTDLRDYRGVEIADIYSDEKGEDICEQCYLAYVQPAIYERWMRAAKEVIELGVELMPSEQLGQWTAVRAVLESFPVEEEDAVATCTK